MSALTIYNPNRSKITTTSSAITLREKKKSITLSKKEEKKNSIVKKKITTNNEKIIVITKKLNQIQKVKIKTERANVKALKDEPAADQKIKTEKFLEDGPKKEKKKKEAPTLKKPSAPNFFDGIFRYLLLTGFNWLVGKLSDKTSGLAKFFSGIGDVIDSLAKWFPKFLDATFGFVEAVGPFVAGAGQFLFNVFVGTLDLAYGVYDGIRQTIGNLFGEEARDQFDNFATKINEFLAISAAVGTALLLTSKVLAAHGPCLRKGKGGGKRGGRGGDTLRDSRNPRGTGGRRVTTSGGRRTGIGGVMDRFGEMNPFKKKPKITGSTGPNIFQRMGDSVGGFAKRTGETITTGARRVVEGVQFLAEGASKQYRRALSGLSGIKDNVIKWGSKGIDNTFQWMSKQKGLLGRIGSAMPDFLKRVGKYIPFAGDAIGFVMDLMGGVDWRRALIRALIGAGIDAGFTATLGALGLAAPFTGGASGIAATALLGAYMTADFAAGGFGRIVGDKVSDALGIPEKAGAGGDAPAPSKMPSDSKVEETIASIEERLNKKIENYTRAIQIQEERLMKRPGGYENIRRALSDKRSTLSILKNQLKRFESLRGGNKPQNLNISANFDLKTFKGYINDQEVSEEEYVAFTEMSRDEKLLNYGVPYNKGGVIKIGAQDFRDLAYIVSGEAARGTNDEYGVAAAVLNRVASPVWPNTVRSVGFQSGQFEAVYTGKAKDEPKLAEKLASPKGQSSIASAMRLLNGRTDFKGQSMLGNKGASDVMFHPRGNFFHYTSQRRKNDPVPQNPNQSWKKLIGPGGPPVDLSTTSAPVGSVEEKEKKQKQEMNPLKALFKMLNIDFGENSVKNNSKSTSQIASPSIQSSAEKLKTPAQISSSPSSALSAAKSNITKASQSLPYQKIKSKPVTKVAVLIKEKTRNIIT